MLYNLHFFSWKCRLFDNATLFGFCITRILNTECAKIWKKKSVAKRLNKCRYIALFISRLQQEGRLYMFPKIGSNYGTVSRLIWNKKILGNHLGFLRERTYHVKSDRNKYPYINTLTLRLKRIRPLRTSRVFSRKQTSRELGNGGHWQQTFSEGHETECLYEIQRSRTSVEEGTFLGFLSCRGFFNRYHRVHVNR